MSFAGDAVEAIKGILTDVPSLVLLLSVVSVLIGVFCFYTMQCLMRWSEKQPWWPAAAPRQKALAMNFGYEEKDITDNGILEGWAYVLTICIHHSATGLLLVPLAIFPESSGSWGVLLFYVGILSEFCYDIWDSLKGVALTFFPKIFSCMEPCPIKMFIVMVICHHGPILIMGMPLLIYYPHAHEFHRISCGLIIAAGLAFSTGSYKFTLDTSSPGDFMRYKLIVVFQLVVILYTRMWLWFTEAYSMLNRFSNDGADTFWWAGVFGICLLTVFNLATVADAVQAAVKWLPRKMPTTDEEKQELEISKSASFMSKSAPKEEEPGLVQMS